MIPEFITAKPSTNRNAADAPSVPDTNSADQTKNRAAFQKALHEQTSERPAEQHDSTADDVRPEESHQSTPPRSSNDKSRTEVSRNTRGAAENNEPRSTADSANSTASDISRSDVNRESESRRQNDNTETSPGTRETSKQIRRIDPANHLTSDDATTRPSENAVENGEVSKPTSEAVLPSFISTDDSDIGTLPSLIRFPLENVAVSQLSADFDSPNATPDGKSSGVAVQRLESSGQSSSNVDSELRPFLNDALIPDAESIAADAQFTATDPSLIAGDILTSPSADNDVLPAAGEELSAIPTLPSLRPEVTSTVSTSLPNENDKKNSETPVIENVAGDVIADGILRSAERSSAATPTDLEPSAQSPTDNAVAFDDSPTAELPLVLPSLISDPKRPTEAATDTEDHNLNPEQTSTREAPTPISPATAAPAVNKSSLQVPAAPQVEAASLDQNVIAENSQVAGSASTFSDDNANRPSKNSASQNPIVVSPAEPGDREPANEVSRRATENSGSSTTVEKTVASSSGDIDSEQSPPRPEVPERTVAGRDVPTVSNRGESSQPAEVNLASATTTSDKAVNVQNHSREAIINAQSNVAPQPAQHPSTSEDRQIAPNVASSAVAANSIDVGSVQIESSNDPASERASNLVAEGNEANSQKQSINASPNQKSARSTDTSQSNPEGPAGSGRSVVETSKQNSGEQSPGGVPITAPGDELAAGSQAGPTASTTVERVAVEPRASNDSQTSSVSNAGAASSASTAQSNSPPAIQSPSAIDASGDATAASPVPAAEVASVSIPSAPAEVSTADGTVISNVHAAATAATSNAAASNSVREPAVPMEIQDAVSAIQEATSGDSHIRVRLNPRELGSMLVDVSRTENGVVARLEVESAAARVAVLETLPDLQQSLSRSGSTVDRVEVVLTETRAESERQESDQSHSREQQSRQERQSSNQQARDEQNERREQNQRRDQREASSSIEEDSTDNETPEQLDIKL